MELAKTYFFLATSVLLAAAIIRCWHTFRGYPPEVHQEIGTCDRILMVTGLLLAPVAPGLPLTHTQSITLATIMVGFMCIDPILRSHFALFSLIIPCYLLMLFEPFYWHFFAVLMLVYLFALILLSRLRQAHPRTE